jgi:hypothetical protein
MLILIYILWQKKIGDKLYRKYPVVFFFKGERLKDFGSHGARPLKTGCPKKLFHDERHAAACYTRRRGTPKKVASAISGHKEQSVFDFYNIVNRSYLQNPRKRSLLHKESLERFQMRGTLINHNFKGD